MNYYDVKKSPKKRVYYKQVIEFIHKKTGIPFEVGVDRFKQAYAFNRGIYIAGLYAWTALSQADIAKIFGVTTGSVQHHLHGIFDATDSRTVGLKRLKRLIARKNLFKSIQEEFLKEEFPDVSV